jgi:hypothetical protein
VLVSRPKRTRSAKASNPRGGCSVGDSWRIRLIHPVRLLCTCRRRWDIGLLVQGGLQRFFGDVQVFVGLDDDDSCCCFCCSDIMAI